MKVSHLVYKVNNLNEGLKSFKSKGFNVELGSAKNPHNALIYFSNGPYIELIEKAPITWYEIFILRLLGRGKVADRLLKWELQKEGYFEICFENYQTNFIKEKRILKKYQQKFFTTKSRRKDPKNRILRWKLLFPFESNLPFFMTFFNINPKPINFVHPNGILEIESVSFGTDANLMELINELCNDKVLKVYEGQGIKDVLFKKQSTPL